MTFSNKKKVWRITDLKLSRKAVVVWRGLFLCIITLNYSKSLQQGTCNNNQTDDCMLPGGILVNDCAVMADHWTASGLDGKNCTKLSPRPPVWNISTPMTITPYHNDCNHLKSKWVHSMLCKDYAINYALPQKCICPSNHLFSFWTSSGCSKHAIPMCLLKVSFQPVSMIVFM